MTLLLTVRRSWLRLRVWHSRLTIFLFSALVGTMKPLKNAGRIVSVVFLYFAVAVSGIGQPSERDPFEFNYPRWMTPPIKPAHRRLERIAFGKDIFVAIGPNQTLLSSKDGHNWTNHSSDIAGPYININYSTKTYSYSGDVITLFFPKVSTNPAPSDIVANSSEQSDTASIAQCGTVSPEQNPRPSQLRNVTFGNGIFVVVGDGGTILSSEDGENWRHRPSGTSAALTAVAWGDPGFVAVGDQGVVFSSTDGIVWTRQTSGTRQRFRNIAYGNGVYVATAVDSAPWISANGIAWKLTEGLSGLSGIVFGNGSFIISGIKMNDSGGTRVEFNQAMASTDGEIWRDIPHPTQNQSETARVTTYNHDGDVNSIAFCGNRFIACTDVGIFVSTHGEKWQPASEPDGYRSDYHGVAGGRGLFVAVGTGDAVGTDHNRPVRWSTVATSKDATTWDVDAAETPPSRLLLANVISKNGVRVQKSGRQILLVTGDGINWRTRDKAEISGTVYGRSQMFCYMGEPVVFSSADGVTWHMLPPSTTDQPTKIEGSLISQLLVPSDNKIQINLNGIIYKLNLSATLGQVLEIQASTNLIDWGTIGQITYTNGPLVFDEPNAASYPIRFFRLKAP
jgi:hypothetical protein